MKNRPYKYRISLSLPMSRYTRVSIYASDEESAREAAKRHYGGIITDVVCCRPATDWEIKQMSNI